MKTQTDPSVVKLVEDYCATGLKGSAFAKARNKLGNKAWPMANKLVKYAPVAMAVVGGLSIPMNFAFDLPAAALYSGFAVGAAQWTGGHIKYLQNIALRQASLFGRHMTRANVPEKIREQAIEHFLRKQSPLYTAEKYIKNNPEMIKRMSNGLPAKLNHNFVSFLDEHTQKAAEAAEKNKTHISMKERIDTYKRAWNDYKITKAQDKAAALAEKSAKTASSTAKAEASATKTMTQEATKVATPAVKTATQEAVKTAAPATKSTLQETVKSAAAPSKAVTQEAAKVATPVAKTAAQEATKVATPAVKTATQEASKVAEQTAKRLPLSDKLVKQISEKTAQKTGAKIATKAALKTGAKKIPIIGAVCGAVFATTRAMDGDWTGAGMELTSGVASCFPGPGTAASLGIDAALIAKDIRSAR